MKSLPDQYNKNGYIFRLHERINDVAIYSQYDPDSERLIAYEVFRVKMNTGKFINGKPLQDKESIPGNEQWGKTGFTCYDLTSAKQKLQQLLNK